MKNNRNEYIPEEAVLADVRTLAPGVKLFTLKTLKGNGGNLHRQGAPGRPGQPGQFYMLSVMGFGEAPISVYSTAREPLAFCIRRVGLVTSALHELTAGDTVGVRGPYGRGFSLETARGRDVVLMAGGLGIVPLRPLIREMMESRGDFKKVFVLYGAKSPQEILFADEAAEWEAADIRTIHTVDCPDEQWLGCVGVVTSQMEYADVDFREAAAYVCGPPVMIIAAMRELYFRGMPDERIVTTLEAHMKCGVGKCGHCYHGPKYICTDGPVFTYRELKELNTPGY